MILSYLEKQHTFAKPGFNRWLVPPAGFIIHLCIGMAYGFSVFWLPLSQALSAQKEIIICEHNTNFFTKIFSSTCEWKISMLNWTYTLFFILLGISTSIYGSWVEHVGPRKAGVMAALFWCGGLLMSAFGVYTHQIWLIWLGSGIIGGIGLGLGYILPVATLIAWFPDHRGMAAGMAIMGFGGGALVGSPLANLSMRYFSTPTSIGVWETLVIMAIIYFILMISAAFSYRIPPNNWKLSSFDLSSNDDKMITKNHVHITKVYNIPQFWLIWLVLCLNVSAGLGIISIASPMLQEVFGGHLLGLNISFDNLSHEQKINVATIGTSFIGLISLSNIIGRFMWAFFSDFLGRKITYLVFFIFGFILYISLPWTIKQGNIVVFVITVCVILSMYGGSFSVLPAYLADLFGTQMIGAIHGRILTAWSIAGIFGPVIVTYIREYELTKGTPYELIYNTILYILAGMLILGLICNLLIRPISKKYFMKPNELTYAKQLAYKKLSIHYTNQVSEIEFNKTSKHSKNLILISSVWIITSIPLILGIWLTIQNINFIFK